MEKPTLDPEEWIISLSDVKRLYISTWKGLIKWAAIGALLAFLYFGNTTPKYKVEASFKEEIEKGNTDIISTFMTGISVPASQVGAASLMKSFQVVRPLVEKLGLQIYETPSEWSFTKIIRRFRETLSAEKGIPLSDQDPFAFENVTYDGEATFIFRLSFLDPEHFIVLNGSKQEMARGKIGEEIKLEGFPLRFTLANAPKKIKMGAVYSFYAINWISACHIVRGQIKIVSDKLNKAILNITFSHRDRHFAVKIVNELMAQYQNYLKREYNELSKEQLAYLESRQEQSFSKMESLFAQHTDYLSRNLKEKGVVGLDHETQSFLAPHQQMQSKVLSIDVELARLNQAENEAGGTSSGENPYTTGFNQLALKIQELKQQRDLIELSLCRISEPSFEARRDELKEIRDKRLSVEKMIQEIDHGGEITSFNIDQGITAWANALDNPEEREDLAECLENYSRLLSMREKMLQERFYCGNKAPVELEGIDLASARSLFLQYNGKLDAAEAAMRGYEQFKKEIPNPRFELASLSSVLRDPTCQKLIAEASALEIQLKDEKHHSSREGDRWLEEIELHKRILAAHLDQLYKVEELNASLIREKMSGLQKLSLDCINQQISVLHEQANDAVKDRRQSLLIEKKLFEEKMEEIRNSLASSFPENWQLERWLKIKTEMANKVMESVTQTVESKTLSKHLHHIGSRPLDVAFLPTAPLPPRLYAMTYLGAFALPFFFFCLAFVRQILKGFPTSLEKLQALRLPVSGSISAFCDGPSVETPTGPDLELLRKLALFSDGGKVIGLIGGKGPDYSFALGENLARTSAKSIVVRCDFLSKFRQEDCPGLLQVWKGEIGEMPIRKGKGFDYLTAGGYTPFGTEIIQSQSFTQLVEILKKNYNWVFLLFRTPISSAESIAALRLCDKAVVTVSGEQTEELTPFVNWGYDGDRCRLTFITRA